MLFRSQVSELTETIIRDWVTFLQQTPPPGNKPLAASSIETYARSVRAFCTWLVQQGELSVSPMRPEGYPRASLPLPHLVSPSAFEQFVQASVPPAAPGSQVRRQAARDRALLWLLFDTGITAAEICSLRVGDLDQDTGLLYVRGKDGKARQIALGLTCLEYLFAQLSQSHAMSVNSEAPLFCSESGLPLTQNCLTLLFVRLRPRAGNSKMPITPWSLRHSFALRYLQAGGNPRGLQELLGYAGSTQITLYLRWHDQLVRDRTRDAGRMNLIKR